MMRGFGRDPNQMGLASSIGIDWKGTRAGRGRQRKMWYRMWYETWELLKHNVITSGYGCLRQTPLRHIPVQRRLILTVNYLFYMR